MELIYLFSYYIIYLYGNEHSLNTFRAFAFMVHLVKLCVGAEKVEDLESFIISKQAYCKAHGLEYQQFHTTRMMPKRADELIGKASLYWVIKRAIICHQNILDIESFKDIDGIKRCNIILEPKIILTQAQPKRPFQGWRYLKDEDAPLDLSQEQQDMPENLRNELSELGLL